MDTSGLTSGDVAERLGVSIPTVRRAARRLGSGTRSPGGHLRLTERDVEQMEALLGTARTVDGLSRTEVLVLAALSRRPLGLRSARAVARAAGVSPTAAVGALDRLERSGVVRHESAVVAEGRPREITIWRLDPLHPRWGELAKDVRATALPASTGPRTRPRRVPPHLRHHFWGGDPASLVLPRDARYVATRLLSSGDPVAASWALAHIDPLTLRDAATNRGIDAATRSMVANALDGA